MQGTLNDTLAQQLLATFKDQDPDMLFVFILLRDADVRIAHLQICNEKRTTSLTPSLLQTIVNATKAIGYRPRSLFMTSAPSEPSFVETMGEDAWYLLGPSQWQPTMSASFLQPQLLYDVDLIVFSIAEEYSDPVFGSASNYANSYLRRFDDPVSFTAAQSTAAGTIRTTKYQVSFKDDQLYQTIGYVLQLGIGAADDPRNQSQVGDALHALDTMHTFYGPVNFDTAGNNIVKPMVITQVRTSLSR